MNVHHRRRCSVALLIVALLALVATRGFANGMRLVSQDGFASARGEAFVATADNPSAIYYNPAGITQLERVQVRSGIYGLYLDPTFQPPAGAPNEGVTYEINDKLAAALQFFCTVSLEDSPVTIGLGVYAPYGASISWPDDTGFRAVATEAELTYLRFNPVIGIKLLPTLSIAAGLMVDYAEIRLEQGLLRRKTPFANFFRFEGEDWSAGANVGLLWQPHEMISFGAALRTPTTLGFAGETEFEQQPIIQPTDLPAKAEFTFPLTVTFGASYRPSPKWNLEVNADYTDWSSLDTVTIRQGGQPPFPVQKDIDVKLNWEASWILSAGVTHYFDSGWHVSGGYVFNENSVPDEYYSPLAADLNRHFFSIGAGRRGKRFDFDVLYQFGYGPDHTVMGSTPSSQPGLFAGQTADGTYHFISHAVLVTVGIRF